jgi:hypothetical protein
VLGSGLLLAATALVTAPAAAAAPSPGAPLGLTPGSGNVAAVPQLTTAGPCPASTTHVYAQLFGGALPADGQVLRDTTRSASRRGGLQHRVVPAAQRRVPRRGCGTGRR